MADVRHSILGLAESVSRPTTIASAYTQCCHANKACSQASRTWLQSFFHPLLTMENYARYSDDSDAEEIFSYFLPPLLRF
jgi:hypothetical protein